MSNVSDNIENPEERAESGLKNPAFARLTTPSQANHGETMAVVSWLRGGHRHSPFPGPDESHPLVRAQILADQIQRGDHIRFWRIGGAS